MKIYATAKNNEPQCLADVLKFIMGIRVVDDAAEYPSELAYMPSSLFAAEDIEHDPEYDQQEEDLMHLGYTDEELWELPLDIIHKMQNVDLLVRVGKGHKNLLSREQQRYIEDILKVKDRSHNQITDADINYMLAKIKSCNKVFYEVHHPKTTKFVSDKKGDIRTAAILRVLKNLTFEDWKYKTRSINYNYLGNTLFIFDPDVSWIDSEGQTKYLRLYIKLDVDASDGLGVALVSFHEYGEGED